MNIKQATELARSSFDIGKGAGVLRQGHPMRTKIHRQFAAVLERLANAHTIDWQEAERIAENEKVDETIRGFFDDPTGDNAICLVRDIIETYLKGTP